MKSPGSENIYSDYKESKAAIVPIPYEKTTSYGKGAVRGAQAIIGALKHVEHYDIEIDRLTSKIRISTTPALKNINTADDLFKKVKQITEKLLKDKKTPVYLGGEHTITAACVSALKNKYPNFTVLHLDAHSDLRDVYGGTKYSHGCVMRRVLEMGLPVVSVGIRSQSFGEHQFIKENKGRNLKIFYAHEILGKAEWIKKVINNLGKQFYITFDVDVMDPSCLPATGTPEPGGFMWYEMADFLKRLAASSKKLIGMDMVELSPIKGQPASDFLSAKLLYKILTLFWGYSW